MRIAFISREYPPDQLSGGIGTHVSNMAEGLAELGHEVEVFGLADEPRREIQNGVLVHRVAPRLLTSINKMALVDCTYTCNALSFAGAFWECLVRRHFQAPFDVLDSGELFADALGNAFSRLLPHLVRLYTPQFLIIDNRFHGLSASADVNMTAALEEFQSKRAQMLTAPSRALAKTVSERWGLVLDDIPIIRNPVNTKLFSPAQYRQKQAPTLLFAGRLDRRKGFDVFMRSLPEIIHRVPDLIVRVVGETNPWDRSFDMELTTLKEDSKRRGEFGRIVFVGSVSRKDMPEQYRMADVVAVPSRYDNSPNTLIEAISCGIPVVGAATGGIPEYLDNGRIGIIVAPESPSAVADAIVGLLKDADRRLHLGKASREWIMENCDRRIVARRTSELHEEVVKRFKAGFALDGIGIKQRPILESVIRETGGEGFLRRRMDFIRFMKCFVRKLKTVVK